MAKVKKDLPVDMLPMAKPPLVITPAVLEMYRGRAKLARNKGWQDASPFVITFSGLEAMMQEIETLVGVIAEAHVLYPECEQLEEVVNRYAK